MRIFFTALILMVTGMVSAQDIPVVTPKIAVKVPLGEIVELDEVSLKFAEVLEDSRCPKDLTCVWEGQAKILLHVAIDKSDFEPVEIVLKNGIEKVIYEKESGNLRVVALNPYPISSDNGKRDYHILITRQNP